MRKISFPQYGISRHSLTTSIISQISHLPNSNFLTCQIALFPLPSSRFLLKFLHLWSLMAVNSSGSSSPVIAPPRSPFAIVNPNSSPLLSNPNSSFQVLINSIMIQNIGSMVQTKLKCHNYLVWKSLLDPIFRRYKLTGIVDGYEPSLPQFLVDPSCDLTFLPNPAFK